MQNNISKWYFLLALANGVVFFILYFLIQKSPLLHSYGMIFLVFGSFFYAICYDYFRRYLTFKKEKSFFYLLLFQLLATLFFLFSYFAKEAFFIVIFIELFSFILLLRILLSIYAKYQRKLFYGVIVAFGMGALSDILYFLAFLPKNKYSFIYFHYAYTVGFYLFIFFLAVMLAFRFIPFFYGFFYKKGKNFFFILFILLFAYVLCINYFPNYKVFISLFLTLLFLREFLKINCKCNQKEPLLLLFILSLFSVIVAFFFDTIIAGVKLFIPLTIDFSLLHFLALAFINNLVVGLLLLHKDFFTKKFSLYYTQSMVITYIFYSFLHIDVLLYFTLFLFEIFYLFLILKMLKIR